ncbi:MAG: branched-chain amino acid aminotransferase [Hyphomonadaceae bacterium]|nr:branched-chain amino acid aminotransferase [Clostridia bacterium]
MAYTFTFEPNNAPKQKPDSNKLGFGQYFTDHMFIADYNLQHGWHEGRIVPYAPLLMDPASMVLHYSQTIFEGLKAYKTTDGKVVIFRPERNIERLNISGVRMGIPPIDEEFALQAVMQLVNTDKDWIPTGEENSLYIRPFIIATDPFLGVRPSDTYKFIVILSPVGAYYPEGINPIKIYVESEYVRAVRGGVGFTKTGGNYAASLKAQMESKDKGYTQVLWLDGCEKKYIEEVGSMNVFFKINGEVITPSLEGSILAGVTRNSVMTLMKDWGMQVTERQISIEEVYEAYQNGTLEEMFGTGTAAVISPVGELNWDGKGIVINNGKTGDLSHKLYDTITKMQRGLVEDSYNWLTTVE